MSGPLCESSTAVPSATTSAGGCPAFAQWHPPVATSTTATNAVTKSSLASSWCSRTSHPSAIPDERPVRNAERSCALARNALKADAR
jgi:hypothetical protein